MSHHEFVSFWIEAQGEIQQFLRRVVRMADKKPGAFELHVDWIRTYGGADTNPSERG